MADLAAEVDSWSVLSASAPCSLESQLCPGYLTGIVCNLPIVQLVRDGACRAPRPPPSPCQPTSLCCDSAAECEGMAVGQVGIYFLSGNKHTHIHTHKQDTLLPVEKQSTFLSVFL